MKQFGKKQKRAPKPNINENIKASSVEVVDKNGNMLGILPLHEAISLAREDDLDLCLISEKSPAPLCKILDYSKQKYLQNKKNREAKKHHHIVEVKGINFRLNIGEHDYATKIKHCCKFLEGGKKVKVNLFFRGREITHQDLGKDLFNRITQDVAEFGKPDGKIALNGKNLSMFVAPCRKK